VGGRVTVVLSDLARDVIAVVAPDQAELFEVVTARWEAGGRPGRGWGWLGGSVGSGIDPAVASDLIYQVLTGTLAQILGTAGYAGLRRTWWRRRQLVTPALRVTLTAAQVEAFRSSCVAHGIALGISKPKAQVYADAAYGCLLRAMADPAQRPS
jgi:hypothetical protein